MTPKAGILTAIACFSALLGCNRLSDFGSPAGSGGEIVVGCSAAMSGPAYNLGTQLTQGSLAYLDRLNRDGGVLGRKVILRCYDDKYDPAVALANTERLINDDKVFALMDYVGTPTAKMILPLVNQSQIPILGLFTGAEFLRTPFQPFVYNVRASYFDEAEALIDHYVAQKKTRIALFMQDDAFGQAVSAGVQVALARHNFELAGIGRYARGAMPDPAEVARLLSLKPDVIVMAGTYAPLAQFVVMAVKTPSPETEFATVSFVGSEALASELVKLGANTANVVVTQVVPSPDGDTPAAKDFRSVYQKSYPEDSMNYTAMEGYVNAAILAEGLKRCGRDCDRTGFRRALEGMSDFDAGTSLKPRIYADNHSFFSSVFLSRMQGGSFVVFQSARQR